MPRKLIYIILDGASDSISPNTSLCLANTGNIDRLAEKSLAGLVYPIEKGIAPESDVATLSMLGYNPRGLKIARGVLEALGAGIEISDGDLALRGNFATIAGDELIDRRVGRSLGNEEGKKLVEEIKNNLKDIKGHKYELVHTVGHRCVLIIRKKEEPLASNITNLDPAYVKLGEVVHALSKVPKRIEECKALDEASTLSAELVNFFFRESNKILERSEVNSERKKKGLLPANAILLRDAGSQIPKIESFKNRYGLKAACIADMPVEIGIAKLLGMDYIWSYGMNYQEKAEQVAKLLGNYDFVFAHIKGADEKGHDGDLEGKIKVIEEIDKHFIGKLLELIDLNEVSILITCDHSTPPSVKAHSDSPVPFMLYAGKLKGGEISKFCEFECSKGSLGLIEHGYMLLDKVLKLI